MKAESRAKYINSTKDTQNDRWKVIAFNSEIAIGHNSNSTWPNFIYFSDGADSGPYRVIRYGKQIVYNKTGEWLNTLIVGQEVYDILRRHPDTSEIREWEEYTKEVLKLIQTGAGNPASLSPYRTQLLADFFGLDKIIIDNDFGKDMLLCCVSEEGGCTLSEGVLFKRVVC